MARKPDPTRARRGTGNRPATGKKRTTVAVLPTRPAVPAPPDDLPQGVHDLWDTAMVELQGQGMRQGDLEAVRMMCLAAWRHRQAAEQVEKFGVLVQGPRGPIVNPMLRVERDSALLYAKLADQFGLTLSARLRLGLIQLAGQSILKSLNDDLDVG